MNGGGAAEPGPRAVLLTGVFGSGKTSVAAEMADLLERRDVRFAALDLDWLTWGYPGSDAGATEHSMMLRNLAPVVANYLDVGARRFVLARSIRTASELDGVRTVLRMPLTVVRLTVPLSEIQERLRPDVTTGRRDDLREAAAWIAANDGVGLEDLTVANDRPIREVAAEILDALGW